LREVGKAAFLQTLDVMRAAARAEAIHLAESGFLSSADDVFLLTFEEFMVGDRSRELLVRLELRRHRRSYYESVELPTTWVGDPVPVAISATDVTSGEELRSGMNASSGEVEGRVRVVRQVERDRFEEGEILVCRTTDPGWTPLLLLAGGVVAELGGRMSHGAIIARELGVPAVLGLPGAMSWLNDGDLVRVDGTKGTVERISAAESLADP
jgi:pyruvate,water dikinase